MLGTFIKDALLLESNLFQVFVELGDYICKTCKGKSASYSVRNNVNTIKVAVIKRIKRNKWDVIAAKCAIFLPSND